MKYHVLHLERPTEKELETYLNEEATKGYLFVDINENSNFAFTLIITGRDDEY